VRLPDQYILNKFLIYAGLPVKRYNGTYNACCPVCREGNSWGKKKRLFYYPDTRSFYCFNCQEGWSPLRWIELVGHQSQEEIEQEAKTENFSREIELSPYEKEYVHKKIILPKDSINVLDPLQQKFYKNNKSFGKALEYIKTRRLDTAINRPDTYFISLTDKVYKDRLCIPFRDLDNKIIFFQCRALGEEEPRYLGKYGDKSVFGVDKIDQNFEYLFMFEGPIDSMFVKNGLGITGLTLTGNQRDQLLPFLTHEEVWVLDNLRFAKDKETRTKYEELIHKGHKVFNWRNLPYKDLNEWAVKEGFDELPTEEIIKNAI